MIIKNMIFFFLAICFNISLAMIVDFHDVSLQQIPFFNAAERSINCLALKRYDDAISWDIEKISAAVSFEHAGLPLIFKYSDLKVHSEKYYDQLKLPENRLFYLVEVDFSDLVPSEILYDQDDDEKEYLTSSQRILFDFSSNQIKDIRWADLCAIYAYFVGLANTYGTFFTATNAGFIFKNNPLSITTCIKLHLLRIVLRLRLLSHGWSFVRYQYVTW